MTERTVHTAIRLHASEKAIHAAVIAHWRTCGLPGTLVATIPNEDARGQHGLTKGLPDLLVLSPELPVGFIELKADKGKLSEEQKTFASMCSALEINHAVTFGRDEPIRVLEAWGVVRPQVCAKPVETVHRGGFSSKRIQGVVPSTGKRRTTREPVE